MFFWNLRRKWRCTCRYANMMTDKKKTATEIYHIKGSTTTRTPFGTFWNTQSEALECRCQEETMWLCTLRIWSVIWAVAARSLWLIVGFYFYPIYWGLSWFITIHDGTSLTHYKGTTCQVLNTAHMMVSSYSSVLDGLHVMFERRRVSEVYKIQNAPSYYDSNLTLGNASLRVQHGSSVHG